VPLRRHLFLGGDGVDRAGLDAGVAVDALVGVDVELLVLLIVRLLRRWVDAVDRAHLHTQELSLVPMHGSWIT
jgi:hypothetical protein